MASNRLLIANATSFYVDVNRTSFIYEEMLFLSAHVSYIIEFFEMDMVDQMCYPYELMTYHTQEPKYCQCHEKQSQQFIFTVCPSWTNDGLLQVMTIYEYRALIGSGEKMNLD